MIYIITFILNNKTKNCLSPDIVVFVVFVVGVVVVVVADDDDDDVVVVVVVMMMMIARTCREYKFILLFIIQTDWTCCLVPCFRFMKSSVCVQ